MTVPCTLVWIYAETHRSRLVEGRWSVRREDLLRRSLWDAVRQREAEVLLQELLDVRPPDVGVLLDLNDLEDLRGLLASLF
jgi:hypothetical protein